MKQASKDVRSSLTGKHSNNPIFFLGRVFIPRRSDSGIVNLGRLILITIVVLVIFACATSVGAAGFNEVPVTSKRGAGMLAVLAFILGTIGLGVALWGAIGGLRKKMDKGTTSGLVIGGLVLLVIAVVIAILAGNEASESKSSMMPILLLLGITIPLSRTHGRQLNVKRTLVYVLIFVIALSAVSIHQNAMAKSAQEAGGFEVNGTAGILAIIATPNANGCKYDAFIGTELLQSRQDPKKCSLNVASAFWVTIKEAAKKKLHDLKRTDVDQLLRDFAEGFKNPKFTLP